MELLHFSAMAIKCGLSNYPQLALEYIAVMLYKVVMEADPLRGSAISVFISL